jgi:hypothetical protein
VLSTYTQIDPDRRSALSFLAITSGDATDLRDPLPRHP